MAFTPDQFQPDLTPEQMEALGVLVHKGSQYKDGEPKENFFGVRASLDTWPDKWHNEQHPQGWFQWYKGYATGKRTDDDERQMKRWVSFKARHLGSLKKADPTLVDLTVQPKRRQALLNWGIAPGIQMTKTNNKYLDKIASVLVDLEKQAEEEKSNHRGLKIGAAGVAGGYGGALVGDYLGGRVGAIPRYERASKTGLNSAKHIFRTPSPNLRKGFEPTDRLYSKHIGLDGTPRNPAPEYIHQPSHATGETPYSLNDFDKDYAKFHEFNKKYNSSHSTKYRDLMGKLKSKAEFQRANQGKLLLGGALLAGGAAAGLAALATKSKDKK